MINQTFLAFLNEAQFTKDLLAIGITQIRKANYATKGIYFQSFTCLSTGIERICKLCLILDYYINNEGTLPNESYVRSHGHKITDLFKLCQEISIQQQINHRFKQDLEDEIHQAIIEILTNFAKSSGRYSNINILVGKEVEADCMRQWHENVDLALYEKHVTQNKKRRIEINAVTTGELMRSFSTVHYILEDGIEIYDPVVASKMTGIWEAVAKYRQLYLLQITRFLVEIIMELGYKAIQINAEDIPHFSEIFGLFYNNNDYFKSRRTWDRI